MRGTIIAIVRASEDQRGGFGFIRDEFNTERFFHARNLAAGEWPRICEGTRVVFEPIAVNSGKQNGLQAIKIEVVK